eukprot:scaffold1355_cov268-Pinguiococcus_pyrenoidosus.AAC.83
MKRNARAQFLHAWLPCCFPGPHLGQSIMTLPPSSAARFIRPGSDPLPRTGSPHLLDYSMGEVRLLHKFDVTIGGVRMNGVARAAELRCQGGLLGSLRLGLLDYRSVHALTPERFRCHPPTNEECTTQVRREEPQSQKKKTPFSCPQQRGAWRFAASHRQTSQLMQFWFTEI